MRKKFLEKNKAVRNLIKIFLFKKITLCFLIKYCRLPYLKQLKPFYYFKIQHLNNRKDFLRNRVVCPYTGRTRGLYQTFGISRMILKNLINNGELPGIKKFSW